MDVDTSEAVWASTLFRSGLMGVARDGSVTNTAQHAITGTRMRKVGRTQTEMRTACPEMVTGFGVPVDGEPD